VHCIQVLAEIELERRKLMALFNALSDGCVPKSALFEFAGKGTT
jgi:hypothetical protein